MENDDVKVCNICERVYRVSRYGDWCPECGRGWRESKGAIAELAYAKALNLEVIYEPEV